MWALTPLTSVRGLAVLNSVSCPLRQLIQRLFLRIVDIMSVWDMYLNLGRCIEGNVQYCKECNCPRFQSWQWKSLHEDLISLVASYLQRIVMSQTLGLWGPETRECQCMRALLSCPGCVAATQTWCLHYALAQWLMWWMIHQVQHPWLSMLSNAAEYVM